MKPVPVDWIRTEIRELTAYPIEHERVAVKLDANELGLELPAALTQAFREVHERVDLRHYPQGHADSLVEAVAQAWGVDRASVLVGNGSNEMIGLVFSSFARASATSSSPSVVIPSPTFGVYPIQARCHGFTVHEVPLGPRFRLEADAVIARARDVGASAIVLASPNNPTGNAFDRDGIVRILESFDGPVVVDEAYQPFATHAWLGCWDRWPNLLVLRTLSKVGLAGLRVGFLFADPRLTAELRKAKLPFNLNAVSATLAEVAMRRWSELEAVADQVVRERERMYQALVALSAAEPFASDANFVLFRVKGDADRVWSKLLQRGISVRNFSRKPGLAGCLRVTVGTPTENETFLEALSGLLDSSHPRGGTPP